MSRDAHRQALLDDVVTPREIRDHLECVRQETAAVLRQTRARQADESGAVLEFTKPGVEVYLAQSRGSIWQEGQRRKRTAQVRTRVLLASAAALVWGSWLILRPSPVPMELPALARAPSHAPTTTAMNAQPARPPSEPGRLVHTGDIPLGLEVVKTDELLNHLGDLTAALVGDPDQPQLYVQRHGSFEFIPLN